jgi:flavin-dependent dehydrogenase
MGADHRASRERRKEPTVKGGLQMVVIGGGPAGAFFAIEALRKASESGRKIEVAIIEKKEELTFYEPTYPSGSREGCNYCAGGISPRMSSVLEDLGLMLPKEIEQGRATSLTVQGDWKNIELRVPEGRKILLVYRGSRPKSRPDRYFNFDSYLLEKAVDEGAKLVTGEVEDVQYSRGDRPLVTYRVTQGQKTRHKHMESDFVVFAGGVNQALGTELEKTQLFRVMQRLIPRFKPPKVRRALIFELEVEEDFVWSMEGEIYFVEYGSKDLEIEASSLVPKGKFVTVALIGPSIDRTGPSENLEVIKGFLGLPHVERLLPKSAKLATVCSCNPNMTVGVAKNPFGNRVAVIGDMATSRLYKDGIYSAYLTASTLVNTILDVGLDRRSLKKGYWPVIRKFKVDNWFGRLVFAINRITFSSPLLSRIVYQAVLTERKTRTGHRRRLENILWRIASGDDEYGNIFISMFHSATLSSILVGGALVTLRNYLAELLLGLKWQGFGRYPTGVYREALDEKRQELVNDLGMHQLKRHPEFERIYSIRIRSDRERIFCQLGKFGDEDREYLRPRAIRVRRVSGGANEVGSVIHYGIPFKGLSFSVALDRIVGERYLVYRVMDGFPKGGVLVFVTDKLRERDFLLSIYVAFDFPKEGSLVRKLFWRTLGPLFPGFIHDVLWNHSLCEFKDLVEMGERSKGKSVTAPS